MEGYFPSPCIWRQDRRKPPLAGWHQNGTAADDWYISPEQQGCYFLSARKQRWAVPINMCTEGWKPRNMLTPSDRPVSIRCLSCRTPNQNNLHRHVQVVEFKSTVLWVSNALTYETNSSVLSHKQLSNENAVEDFLRWKKQSILNHNQPLMTK